MAVKIKLKRLGKIREPYYRIVVADARTKRDGRAIEEIGKYHPKADPSFIEVNSERVQHWLSVGAQPTNPVRVLLKITGDWQKFTGEPGAEGTLKHGRAEARTRRSASRLRPRRARPPRKPRKAPRRARPRARRPSPPRAVLPRTGPRPPKPPPRTPRRLPPRTAPPSEGRRGQARRGRSPAEAKPADAKPAEAKAADAKPAEAKAADAKPAEAKAAEASAPVAEAADADPPRRGCRRRPPTQLADAKAARC